MSTRFHESIKEKGGIYFYTTSIFGHQNLFLTKEYIDILIQSFEFAERERNLSTIIKTIMPNHLHWIFQLSEDECNPIPIYQSFAKFTARMIIETLIKESVNAEYKVLKVFKDNSKCYKKPAKELLKFFQVKTSRKEGHKHKVWNEKPDLKLIESPKFLEQKVKYVFQNPAREPWLLVNDLADYPYTFLNQDLLFNYL